MGTRDLVVRRNKRGQLCLHDAQTGQPLAAQASLNIVQEPGEVTAVIVRFVADPRAPRCVRIEADD